MNFSFSAGFVDVDAGEEATLQITIASDIFELNVSVRVSELARLEQVLVTPWRDGSLQLGTSADSAAWWSCDDGRISIWVGHDNQTSDICVSFPVSEFVHLRASIDHELAGAERS